MKQYEIYFTNEYIDEIISELSVILDISVKKTLVNEALNEKDIHSKNNIFRKKNEQNTIIIDCNNRDWIFPLVVLCDDLYSENVNEVLLKWDNMIREEYGQEKTEEIKDVYGKTNTLLESIENYYDIKLN